MTAPPPTLRVEPGIWFNGDDKLTLRRYCNVDGDYTNAIINMGVKLLVGEREVVDFGLDLMVPPRLFWLLDLIGMPTR